MIKRPGRGKDALSKDHRGGKLSWGQPKPKKVFIRPEFSEPYKLMAFHGDRQLRHLCDKVIYQIWGYSNRRLGKLICDDFQSNNSWIMLTIVYGLDVLVEVIPLKTQGGALGDRLQEGSHGE